MYSDENHVDCQVIITQLQSYVIGVVSLIFCSFPTLIMGLKYKKERQRLYVTTFNSLKSYFPVEQHNVYIFLTDMYLFRRDSLSSSGVIASVPQQLDNVERSWEDQGDWSEKCPQFNATGHHRKHPEIISTFTFHMFP